MRKVSMREIENRGPRKSLSIPRQEPPLYSQSIAQRFRAGQEIADRNEKSVDAKIENRGPRKSLSIPRQEPPPLCIGYLPLFGASPLRPKVSNEK